MEPNERGTEHSRDLGSTGRVEPDGEATTGRPPPRLEGAEPAHRPSGRRERVGLLDAVVNALPAGLRRRLGRSS
jgi:hypothetical protein